MNKNSLMKIQINESVEHIHDIALAYTIEESKTDEKISFSIENFYDQYERNCEALISHTQKKQ